MELTTHLLVRLMSLMIIINPDKLYSSIFRPVLLYCAMPKSEVSMKPCQQQEKGEIEKKTHHVYLGEQLLGVSKLTKMLQSGRNELGRLLITLAVTLKNSVYNFLRR